MLMLGFLSDTLNFGNTILKTQNSFAWTCSEITGIEKDQHLIMFMLVFSSGVCDHVYLKSWSLDAI